MKCYLSGPITSLSFGEADSWRRDAAAYLRDCGVEAVNPLRAKEYLQNVGRISGAGDLYGQLGAFSTPAGILCRDRFDVMRCDVVLANLLGAERVSIGTCFELAWADMLRKPIVLVMEAAGNVHDHVFVTHPAGFRATSLLDAYDIVVRMKE